MATASNDWGTCSFCGDAVPPDGRECPTCGNPLTVASRDQYRALPKRTRSWMRFLRVARVVIVAGLVIGLSYEIVSNTMSGPPVLHDPLTTSASYYIPSGSYVQVSGEITGEDYVVGNYSVVNPMGFVVSFAVFNSSEFALFQLTGNATPTYSVAPITSGEIIFAAPYTDTFYLVFQNPYHGPQLELYAATNYESNVVID